MRIFIILILALILTTIGFSNLFSVSYGWTSRLDRQLISVFLGIILLSALQFIDFNHLIKYAPLGYLFGLFTLLVIPFGGGKEIYGAVRWINIGNFQFQPSEFAKVFLIMMLSYVFKIEKRSLLKFIIGFMLFAVYALLVYIQPDLGTSLVMLAIFLIMVLISEIPIKYIGILLLIVTLLMPFGWFALKDYQQARLLVFLNPGLDPGGIGYNLKQALIAVGSGKFTGKGFLKGTQARLGFLPVPQSDFAFASILEEGGFRLGILIIMSIAFLLILTISLINNPFSLAGKLVVAGVFGMLAFESFVNIAMNIGLVPVVGLPLPFISYGGSAMVKNFVSLGLIISACKKSKLRRLDVSI